MNKSTLMSQYGKAVENMIKSQSTKMRDGSKYWFWASEVNRLEDEIKNIESK